MKKIGFVGAGNMAAAIMTGILRSELKNEVKILVYDVDKEKLSEAEKLGACPVCSNAALAGESDIIFLLVKPQVMESVLAELKSGNIRGKTVVSFAAGITEENVRCVLGEELFVMLAMPNTPMLIGKGACAVAKTQAPGEVFEMVVRLLKTCGEVAVIGADKMCEIIPVNASAPAYIYRFIKSFCEFAAEKGIDENTAKMLFCQTLAGSAQMVMQSEETIDDLIAKVTSKGGTTFAGLAALDEGRFDEVVRNCCEATVKRAYELSEGK